MYTITEVIPGNEISVGDQLIVTVDSNAVLGDLLVLDTVTLTTAVSGNMLMTVVPKLSAPQVNMKIVNGANVLTADFPLTIIPWPQIIGFQSLAPGATPFTMTPNTYCKLFGMNFGSTQGNSAIYFPNHSQATITDWSPTVITIKVPSDAITGFVTLRTKNSKLASVAATIVS